MNHFYQVYVEDFRYGLPAIDGLELGTHRVNIISGHIAFCVTAFTGSLDQQKSHLIRLLECLPLKGLHWINHNHSKVSMITLVKGMRAME